MANTFKVVTKAGVTSADVIYTVASSTTTVVLGIIVREQSRYGSRGCPFFNSFRFIRHSCINYGDNLEWHTLVHL